MRHVFVPCPLYRLVLHGMGLAQYKERCWLFYLAHSAMLCYRCEPYNDRSAIGSSCLIVTTPCHFILPDYPHRSHSFECHPRNSVRCLAPSAERGPSDEPTRESAGSVLVSNQYDIGHMEASLT